MCSRQSALQCCRDEPPGGGDHAVAGTGLDRSGLRTTSQPCLEWSVTLQAGKPLSTSTRVCDGFGSGVACARSARPQARFPAPAAD